MDDLDKKVFAEVKAHSGKQFTLQDLSHLQSPFDVSKSMLRLWENGLVGGEVQYSTNPSINAPEGMKYIVYHKE